MKITITILHILILPMLAFAKAPPNEVLIGSDTRSINSFKKKVSCKESSITGGYKAETGGASLRLKIQKSKKGLILEREFSEPGDTPNKRTYSSLTKKGCLWESKALAIVDSKEGLLVWEKNPQVFGVPENMWILYGK